MDLEIVELYLRHIHNGKSFVIGVSPLAILSTLMTLMMVGFMKVVWVHTSSMRIPAIERRTMIMSNTFHLRSGEENYLQLIVKADQCFK